MKAFYFPHDYNASNDIKCLFLRQALGMEGYGIFWFLIEQLANAGGKLPINVIPLMAMQMQVTETKVHAVITKFNLFEIDEDDLFFSNRLDLHLNERKLLAEKGKQGAEKRWGNRESNREAISYPNSNKRKESKEIKENEIKESKENVSFLSFDLILNEFKKESIMKRPFLVRMQDVHSMDYKEVENHFQKWATLNEGKAMTLSHSENSFNLYLKNNQNDKKSDLKKQNSNVFAEMLNEQNQTQS